MPLTAEAEGDADDGHGPRRPGQAVDEELVVVPVEDQLGAVAADHLGEAEVIGEAAPDMAAGIGDPRRVVDQHHAEQPTRAGLFEAAFQRVALDVAEPARGDEGARAARPSRPR